MRRTPVVLVCLATVGLLAGCGVPATRVGSAALTSRPAFTPLPTVTYPAPTRFDSVAMMVETVQQSVARSATAHLATTITSNAGVIRMEGDIRYDVVTKNYAFDCAGMISDSARNHSINVHQIILPEGTFVKPPSAQQAQSGASWLKLNTASKDPIQRFHSMVQDQLRQVLEFSDVLPAAGTITKTASEPTREGPATRYDITADLMAMAGPINDPTKRAFFERLAKAGISTIDNSVLIDSYNHPMEINSKVPLSALGTGLHDITTDTTFDHWGKETSIIAPPADKVTS